MNTMLANDAVYGFLLVVISGGGFPVALVLLMLRDWIHKRKRRHIRIEGKDYEIASVQSATQITINDAWQPPPSPAPPLANPVPLWFTARLEHEAMMQRNIMEANAIEEEYKRIYADMIDSAPPAPVSTIPMRLTWRGHPILTPEEFSRRMQAYPPEAGYADSIEPDDADKQMGWTR